MTSNPVRSGYLNFLIGDLQKLRENHWSSAGAWTPPAAAAPPPADSPPPAYDEIDIEDGLASGFAQWQSSPGPLSPPAVPFPVLAHVTFKILARQSRHSSDCARWAAELWCTANAAPGQIQSCLRREVPLFASVVASEDNPWLWFGVFELLGCLRDREIIPFSTLIDYTRYLERGPHPELYQILERLPDLVAIDASEAIDAIGSGTADARTVAALVDLVEAGPPRPPDERSPVSVGLYVRDLVFAALGEGSDDSALSGLLQRLAGPLSRARSVVLAVFESALAKCQLPEPKAQAALAQLAQL